MSSDYDAPTSRPGTNGPRDRRRGATGAWWLFVIVAGVGLVVGAGIYAWYGKVHETGRADTAVAQGQDVQQDAKTLAAGVQKACSKGGAIAKELAAYCPKAREVIDQPTIQGRPGSPGRDGADGRDGAPGRPGRDGTPGADGRPGATGPTGPPGPPGTDGEPGRPGADGSPGADGTPGVDGSPGADGKPGVDGQDGTDGQDGQDGAPGRGVVSIQCGANTDRQVQFTFVFTDGTTQTVTCDRQTPPPTSPPPTVPATIPRRPAS